MDLFLYQIYYIGVYYPIINIIFKLYKDNNGK